MKKLNYVSETIYKKKRFGSRAFSESGTALAIGLFSGTLHRVLRFSCTLQPFFLHNRDYSGMMQISQPRLLLVHALIIPLLKKTLQLHKIAEKLGIKV